MQANNQAQGKHWKGQGALYPYAAKTMIIAKYNIHITAALLLALQCRSVLGLSSGTASKTVPKFPTPTAAAAATTSTKEKVTLSEVSLEPTPSTIQGQIIGERVKFGESIIQLQNLVSPDECEWLRAACLHAANVATPTRELDKPGLVRLPTIAAAERAAITNTLCADPLPRELDGALQSILDRAAKCIDEEIPTVSSTLFGTDSIADLIARKDQLQYSSREPAVNIYTAGGEFLAHKDAQSLTVLIPLSSPTTSTKGGLLRKGHFTGGGTAFWHQDARGHRVEDPTTILIPEEGTAMLFGGCVTHAGVAVESGCRVVFVASFSLKGCLEAERERVEQRDIYGDSM